VRFSDLQLKKLITQYKLLHKASLFSFIKENPEGLSLDALSRIVEIANAKRLDNAAYYTDPSTIKLLSGILPDIPKKVIRVLEPAVGVGNFLQIIIDKYAPNAESLVIDVNDIDSHSIELTKLLNSYRDIPANVVINYTVGDFLPRKIGERYDLVIGNPPFIRLTSSSGLGTYSRLFDDSTTTNLSGYFLQKSLNLSDYVLMIMPKYFLSSPDFSVTRERVSEYAIKYIMDFGESGFQGVLIETIAVLVSTTEVRGDTVTYSVPKNVRNVICQTEMTSSDYPCWLLYRDDFFNRVASSMQFGVFRVFRDRQLTKSVMNQSKGIRVLKSRNIKRDGSGIAEIPGYDSYVDESHLGRFTVSKYYDRDDVFLSPNMTYYPRVIRKPKNTLVNGSVAILEKDDQVEVTEFHLKFLSGPIFERFYRIARNYSTRSLNIDNSSVFFFGLLENSARIDQIVGNLSE